MHVTSQWPKVSAAALAATLGAGAQAAEIPVGLLGTLTCSMERESGDGPAEKARGREALCEFRLRDGTLSETYLATLQFAGQDTQGPAPAETMILIVKAPLSTAPIPGMLQQSYAADASSSQDPAASKAIPLIGAKASFLVLQPEPKAAEPVMALGRGTVTILLSVALKLRSSTS